MQQRTHFLALFSIFCLFLVPTTEVRSAEHLVRTDETRGRAPAVDRVIVRFREGTPAATRAAAHAAAGAAVLRQNQTLNYSLVRANRGGSAAALQAYRNNPAVERAELDAVRHLSITPNDTFYSNPPADPRAQVGSEDHQRWTWNGLGNDRNIDAEPAWDLTQGRSDVVVGVVDSGVDLDHPDLASNIWVNPGEIPNNNQDDDNNGFVDDVNGYDFVGNDGNPDPTLDADGLDDDGNGYVDDGIFHGTFVAGMVCSRGNDNYGGAGAAWNSKVMVLRVFADDGGAFVSDIVDAMTYAANNGAHVTNYSYTAPFPHFLEQDAVNLLHSMNVVQVAAAGNGGSTATLYPAGYGPVIGVGSTDHGSSFMEALSGRAIDLDGAASFSQYGPNAVDVVAPGRYVLSTLLPLPGRNNEGVFYTGIPGGTGVHAIASGTSFASPIVAGLAALIISRDLDIDGVRDLDNDAVKNHIETHSVDLPGDNDPSRSSNWDGKGRVSFRLAIEALGGSGDLPPSVEITAPQNGDCFASGALVTLSADASDNEDPVVTVVWTSDIDGDLGTGDSIFASLSDGTHTITASVTDSASHTRTDQVAIFVGPADPVANAGPDQTHTDDDNSGDELVTLNGTGSTDSCGGTIVAWEWHEDGQLIATGATPTVTLAIGTHQITLTVFDDEGGSDTDSVVIVVEEGLVLPGLVFVECIEYSASKGNKRRGGRNLFMKIGIIDEDGFPVANAEVGVVLTLDGFPYATGSGFTGADGKIEFRLSRAPDGCYSTVVAGVITENFDLFDGFTPPNQYCKGPGVGPATFCR